MAQAYLTVICLTHFGFAAVVYTFYRRGPSRFTAAFLAAWALEGLRALILLLPTTGIALPDWSDFLLENLYLPVSWCLLYCAFRLLEVPLPRWVSIAYLAGSLVMLAGIHLGLVPLLDHFAWSSPEAGAEIELMATTLLLFIPGTLIRLVLTASFFTFWQRTRLLGALIGGVFALPHAVGSAIVPFEVAYHVTPLFAYLSWFIQILGLSVGVLLLLVDQQGASLLRARQTVKSLEQLLPICSHCRQIRSADGRWRSLEEYLMEEAQTVVTHGLCNRCAEHYLTEAGLDPSALSNES